jgi:photosystem II stability/assembly factor-like uncharacterized protein
MNAKLLIARLLSPVQSIASAALAVSKIKREPCQKQLTFLKNFSCFLLVTLTFFFFNVNAALAHRPHDVVSQVEISPTYERDRTLFIIVRNNLFKSTDEGNSWKRLVKGLDNHFDFTSLAIFPGTQKTLFVSSLGDGIYKSQDEGESWSKVNRGLDNLKLDLLAVSDKDSNLILAAGADKGLYKTTDGGNNWKSAIENNIKITAIAFFPENPDRVVISDNRGTFYLSDDRGETWQQKGTIQNGGKITAIAIPLKSISETIFWVGTEQKGILKTNDLGNSFSEMNRGLSDKNIRDIAILPTRSKDSSLWATTWNEGGFQSLDGGNTWKKFSDGLVKDSQADDLASPHFVDIRVSPNFSRDKTLFVGGFNGLYKSIDGGEKWQELETLSPGTITALSVSPNYENDSTIAIVTYVGKTYISNDKGATWKTSNKGLEVPRFTGNFEKPNQDPRRFFDVAFAPNYATNGNIFATILWDNFLKSTNRGDRWDIVRIPNIRGYATRGMTIVPSPNFDSDKTVYLGTQYGVIYRSTDGGNNFSAIGKVGNRSTNEPLALVISPDFESDRTLYASGPQGVHKTVDGGRTWQSITKGTALMKTSSIQLAISPNYKADRTVIAGTSNGLFITKDSGKSWAKLEGIDGSDSFIEGVAISPNYQSDRTFLISIRGKGLFKTIDGGQIFTKIGNDSISLSRMNSVPSAGIPIHFSPAYATDRTIYGFGSSTTEIYKSTDSGDTWETVVVPKNEDSESDLLTSISIWATIYRGRILRIAAALIASLASYWLLGYLSLEKRLPFSKLQIKMVGALTVFVVALVILHA